jgi:hypothetical protein
MNARIDRCVGYRLTCCDGARCCNGVSQGLGFMLHSKATYFEMQTMTQPIFEIRDYTIAHADYAAYKTWAEDLAGPWLKANLNVLEFWMDVGIEAEVSGTDPKVSPHGQANVCWIIRWDSMAERKASSTWTSSPEWQAIWAKHPNPNAYLQMNARFMTAVG